jgi:hypothetical protein
LQHALFKDAMNPKTPARERAQVACAWERLEERKRILRMKPKPKDLDVSDGAKSKRRAVGVGQWTGPVEVPPTAARQSQPKPSAETEVNPESDDTTQTGATSAA